MPRPPTPLGFTASLSTVFKPYNYHYTAIFVCSTGWLSAISVEPEYAQLCEVLTWSQSVHVQWQGSCEVQPGIVRCHRALPCGDPRQSAWRCGFGLSRSSPPESDIKPRTLRGLARGLPKALWFRVPCGFGTLGTAVPGSRRVPMVGLGCRAGHARPKHGFIKAAKAETRVRMCVGLEQ